MHDENAHLRRVFCTAFVLWMLIYIQKWNGARIRATAKVPHQTLFYMIITRRAICDLRSSKKRCKIREVGEAGVP